MSCVIFLFSLPDPGFYFLFKQTLDVHLMGFNTLVFEG